MTQEDVMSVARTLKSLKPDADGGTVGERLLWARVVEQTCTLLMSRTARRRWSPEQFYEAAGSTGAADPAPEDEGGDDDL